MDSLELPEGYNLEDLPLGHIFERASAVAARVETFAPSEETNALLREGVAWLEVAEHMVETFGLFSSNEDRDDIQTSSLRYLMLHYYVGELHSHINTPTDPATRKGAVEAAVAAYSTFLGICDRHALLGESEAALRQEDAGPVDRETNRANKIARFKREKAIKAQLEEYSRRRMEQMRAAHMDNDDSDDPSAAGVDEEEERKAWILQIELAAQKSLEARRFLVEETDILQHMAGMSQEERARPTPAVPPEVIAELRKAATSLATDREQRKAQVFRPSHNLPTMSLRELADIETADAMRRQQEEADAAAREAAKGERDSDDEEEVQRQRRWDDWTDDNPRGAGNSKLRPCA